MKKEIGVWIDHRQAVIVTLLAHGEEEITHIASDMEKHVRFSGASQSGTPTDHNDSTASSDSLVKIPINQSRQQLAGSKSDMSNRFWISGIKLLHTLVFFVESMAILYILYSGLFNVRGPAFAVAIVLVLTEVIVFVASGTRCPLTKWARLLGDTTGNDFLGDFMPERFAKRIPLVCGGLALIGFLMVGLRLLMG